MVSHYVFTGESTVMIFSSFRPLPALIDVSIYNSVLYHRIINVTILL